MQQFKNVVNDVVVRRLERRMKTARHRAYQIHYEASMAKVLQEEARKKEAAREAKKNKKRKLLPVVEDPVVKIDRKKGKGKKKPTSTTTAEGEEVGHTGFVIKLKGNLKPDDSMELDDVDSARRHSFLAGRPTPKFLPALPQPPPGEQLTPSDLRAYDRLVKATERRFDQFISSVWKDIAKKDIAKAYRQMDLSLKAKQSNAKKTVQLAAKEARRWQARSTKASKEMQIKSKKAMREVFRVLNIVNGRCFISGERMREKNETSERKRKRKLLTVLNEKKNSAKRVDKPVNSTFSSPKRNFIPTSSARKSMEWAEKNPVQMVTSLKHHLSLREIALVKGLINSKIWTSMPMTMKHYGQLQQGVHKMPSNLPRIRRKISIWRLDRMRNQQPLRLQLVILT